MSQEYLYLDNLKFLFEKGKIYAVYTTAGSFVGPVVQVGTHSVLIDVGEEPGKTLVAISHSYIVAVALPKETK